MVIGIDTSGTVCSVAVVSDSVVLGEFTLDHKKTHSAMLIPMLDRLMETLGLSLEDASLFACAKGPGSFTGLRIGAASAKGMAFGLNKPLIGVSTLGALSYNLYDVPGIVCPIMDARRNEVYTGVYDHDNIKENEPFGSVIIDESAIPIEELLKLIKEKNPEERRVTFLGDGVKPYREVIEKTAEFPFSFAAPGVCLQRASSVAVLGETLYRINQECGPFTLSYLRKPQAEREKFGP